MALLVLVIIWFVLFVLTFRSPDAPRVGRLVLFILWLAIGAALLFSFLVRVTDYNPNPAKLRIAHYLTDNKLVDLSEIAPGVFDLDYILRIDTDWEDANAGANEETAGKEWLVFYKYDVVGTDTENPEGPFGAAIYDHDQCRPPALLSYELVPVNYEYLGEDKVSAKVENIIPWFDPVSVRDSELLDRPEVIVAGATRGAVTDLNIFRKVGVELNCLQRQQWQEAHPGEAFPNPIRYENIGSFRGNYLIERDGATITVVDRAGLERSQLTVRKQYRPENGSYYQPGAQALLDPVEYSLSFGPGEPDDVPQVYYPEKAVLAFYEALGKDKDSLKRAETYLSDGAQTEYHMESDPFGLSTDPSSVARARGKLARVLVWEIGYIPDVDAERQHEDRMVTVTVAGVNDKGNVDYAHPCEVIWTVIGVPNDKALPYGCEWRLDWYQSTCQESKEQGESGAGEGPRARLAP